MTPAPQKETFESQLSSLIANRVARGNEMALFRERKIALAERKLRLEEETFMEAKRIRLLDESRQKDMV